MAEKAKEQASQLGEAAFSGAGNIAAATGLVKKEEFPADLKVIRPLPAHRCTAPASAGTPRWHPARCRRVLIGARPGRGGRTEGPPRGGCVRGCCGRVRAWIPAWRRGARLGGIAALRREVT